MRGLTFLLLVLFLATSVWMSLIAKRFVLDKPNPCCENAENTFSIFQLEFPKESCTELMIAGMNKEARHAVQQHLDLDYVFMIGAYLGIMCLNLWVFLNGRDKGKNWGKWLLLILCCLQPVAWGLDIAENMAIQRWIWRGHVDASYGVFNTRSYIKFIIGISGALIPIVIAIVRKFQSKQAAAPIAGTVPAN